MEELKITTFESFDACEDKFDDKKPILSTDEIIEVLEKRKQNAINNVKTFEELFPSWRSNFRKDVFLYQEAILAIKFKKTFDNFYGIGLDIANLHANGELEPFDNIYESACM